MKKHILTWRIFFFAAIVFVLSVFLGCRNHMEAAKNNIIPLGDDTYTLSYSGANYSAVRTIVYKTSLQHCENQGKSFSLQSERRPAASALKIHPLAATENVELVFKCLPPDDDVELDKAQQLVPKDN